MSLTRRQFLKISAGILAALGIGESTGEQLLADDTAVGNQGGSLAESLAMNVASFPKTITSPSGRVSQLDRTRLLLFFTKPLERETIEGFINHAGDVLEDSHNKSGGQLGAPLPKVTHSPRRFWIRLPDGQKFNQQNVNALIHSLPPSLSRIGAVYQLPDKEGLGGLFSPMPDVLIIKTVPKVNEASLAKALARFNLKEVPRKSKVGGGYRYFALKDPTRQTVYALPRLLLKKYKQLITQVHFEKLYLQSRAAHVPSDRLYPQNGAYQGQWNLRQISAEKGWDIWNELNVSSNPVIVCVIDAGCDLDHPDLSNRYTSSSTTILDDRGLPPDESLRPGEAPGTEAHGTNCAGIVAATMDNPDNEGVAGLGANCRLMSVVADELAFEVAQAIRYAVDNGAKVISYSFAYDQWSENDPDEQSNTVPVNAAIDHALTQGLVICAATGNGGISTVSYPASHPGVIACGASNLSDRRCDATDWGPTFQGSNFGNEISVVAPGVAIPTTTNFGIVSPHLIQNGYVPFKGTSAATPHVAALAALLFGRYPTLTGKQVRDTIERTADKINTKTAFNPSGYPYQEKLIPIVPAPNPIPEAGGLAYTNGTWCQDVGYGRINVHHTLDLADVMIKGMPRDNGVEPYGPNGDFSRDTGEIAVFVGTPPINDDDAFLNMSQTRRLQLLSTNHLYVRAFNLGPHEARNVKVKVRLVKGSRPLIGGWDFNYSDWSIQDPTHLVPAPDSSTSNFSTVPAGGHIIAKFVIQPDQVKTCQVWITGSPGVHSPFVLAEVIADNDYAYDKADKTGSLVVDRRNNLAVRGLFVKTPAINPVIP